MGLYASYNASLVHLIDRVACFPLDTQLSLLENIALALSKHSPHMYGSSAISQYGQERQAGIISSRLFISQSPLRVREWANRGEYIPLSYFLNSISAVKTASATRQSCYCADIAVKIFCYVYAFFQQILLARQFPISLLFHCQTG